MTNARAKSSAISAQRPATASPRRPPSVSSRICSTRWPGTIRCTTPFHVHGAGRFLVLSREGVVEPNLVWKDTVLVRTGETVDILLDVTNPGLWMAHCHIAEHHESGMMFSFNVAPAESN